MTSTATGSRTFEPGTTGWTVADLDDPQTQAHWFEGRYEIVEGVLTKMPPAYFSGAKALQELVFVLKAHLKQVGRPDQFGVEVDLVIDEDRVVVADAVWLTPSDDRRQQDAVARLGKSDPGRTRLLVPPTLIIESVSPGHELHDQRTKKRWYAEFGVPNYWILNAFEQTLECLVLADREYRLDVAGGRTDELRPALFPGLVLPLSTLW